jgi:hydroxymethylbilane synthase
MPADRPLRVGTRGSTLARTQTEWVAGCLRANGIAVTVEVISTRGDERHDLPVARLGGDGVFVRELEQALLDGRIDAAVHSLKDMPTIETPGLALACIPERASAFDALVGRTAATLAELPRGAVVGTSSIRRVAQLRRLRADLVIVPLRGNVDTRLRKLDDGEFDAVVLAAAGLQRLGLSSRITEILRPPEFWPAVSQGALAVQSRADDAATRDRLAQLEHADTRAAVTAERRMLAALAGGCLAPIGGWARVATTGDLVLGGCVFGLDEPPQAAACLRAEVHRPRPADGFDEVSLASAARELGDEVAATLVAQGAARVLEDVRRMEA